LSGTLISTAQQARAIEYLRESITALATAVLNNTAIVFGTKLASTQLKGLEQQSYTGLVQRKKDRF
jgi:hypothetical protein